MIASERFQSSGQALHSLAVLVGFVYEHFAGVGLVVWSRSFMKWR